MYSEVLISTDKPAMERLHLKTSTDFTLGPYGRAYGSYADIQTVLTAANAVVSYQFPASIFGGLAISDLSCAKLF